MTTTGPTIYPPADTHSQWVGQGTVTMPMDRVKWLQHTTETAGGWPSYDGGGSAPTLTYEPWEHKWRQHFPINGSARALRNDIYPDVNHYDVVQTEISCYCNAALAKSVGRMDRFVEALDQQAIDDLGNFGLWLHEHWGMALNFSPAAINWPPYNGQQTVKRQTIDQFRAYSGVLGHMAAPGQVHLDPSSLDNVAIAKVMTDGAAQGGGGRWPAVQAIHDDLVKQRAEVLRLRREHPLLGPGLFTPMSQGLADAIREATDFLAPRKG